ncbi:hypothetical protein HDV04_002233 [Boothiomyces sp. JEL0838]|nr:hypothetical protein HDV04_002233 [Boothiomyces sp. JEL0838]
MTMENEIKQMMEKLATGPMPHSNKTDEERMEAVLSHPLFMDSVTDDDMQKDTLAALQSLVFDGTPEEMAENFKIQGNSCFQAGKTKYKDAIDYYTKGILAKCKDNELNSALHSNRAAVHLNLQNYRSVLYDCSQAIKFNPKNIKAYFRSVKALNALDRVDEAIDCSQKALLIEPNNQNFIAELKKLQERKIVLEETAKLERIKQEKKQIEQQALDNILAKRNYRFAKLDEDEATSTYQHPDAPINKIQIDGDRLTFPVVFLYPEFNQSDTISAFHEDDTFYSHFENMFSEPAPWDNEYLYSPQSLDWYFETHVTKKASEYPKLVSVLKSVEASNAPSQSPAHRYVYTTLADVLRHKDFTVVDGVLTFVILSRNSPFGAEYRKKYRSLNQ